METKKNFLTPPTYSWEFLTPEEILELVGFTPDQYQVLPGTEHWNVGLPADSWRDEDGKLQTRQDSRATLYALEHPRGKWQISERGFTIFGLLEGGRNIAPALKTMGVSAEVLDDLRRELRESEERAKEAHEQAIKAWGRALREHTLYSFLPKSWQRGIDRVAERGSLYLSSVAELTSAWADAEALCQRVVAGESLANFGGEFRACGNTGLVNFWVITQDGELREPDSSSLNRRRDEGEKYWSEITPSELALAWRKSYTAAPHEFLVAKLPVGGLTDPQLAWVQKTQDMLEESFAGRRGFKSNAPSPLVGKGWGLGPIARLPEAKVVETTQDEEPPQQAFVSQKKEASSPPSVADLMAKFNRR